MNRNRSEFGILSEEYAEELYEVSGDLIIGRGQKRVVVHVAETGPDRTVNEKYVRIFHQCVLSFLQKQSVRADLFEVS